MEITEQAQLSAEKNQAKFPDVVSKMVTFVSFFYSRK